MVNYRPAIILAAFDDIHLIAAAGAVETARPVFGLEQKPGARLPGDALWISMPECPDLRTSNQTWFTNGLSGGTVPSSFNLRILPPSESICWAILRSVESPVET